jgi:hypothetical protein
MPKLSAAPRARRAGRPRAAWIALASIGLACAPAEDGGSTGDDAVSAGGTEAEAFVTPRDTDILLADLHWETSGPPGIGAPTNLTQRPGYDNQPFFVPDGTGLWYTAIDPHDGQADIWRYDFPGSTVARVTQSNPESEYSATALPDGGGISTIRVEADSTQRLWRFDADGSNGAVLLPELAPVGYHAWADESTLVMFVLGDPATLRRGDVGTGEVETLAEDIGRSLHRMPGTNDVSYVQRHGPDSTTIMRLPANGEPPEPIIGGVDGLEDHGWTPDGTLLMASGAVVHALAPGASEWVPIADFSDLDISITRLAVSPDASQIAMVAEVAALDSFPN